ncbi:DUF2177 family protein [Candidatus Woesearchaeota archaeon]|nr:DUF2177 family protein [Candidatus Woesearchaeota archaeon]
MNKILLFAIVLVFILILDFIFLGLIMKKFYDAQLSSFGRTLRLGSGLIAWSLIALGAVVLVLPFAKGYQTAALYGALYGLILYGVYDFSNFAILKDYTLAMTLVDWAWGTFLCTMTSIFAYFMNSL